MKGKNIFRKIFKWVLDRFCEEMFEISWIDIVIFRMWYVYIYICYIYVCIYIISV